MELLPGSTLTVSPEQRLFWLLDLIATRGLELPLVLILDVRGYASMLAAGDDVRPADLTGRGVQTPETIGNGRLSGTSLQGTVADVGTRDTSPLGLAKAFMNEGEFWSVAFEGRVVRLKDSKGLHYLAQLLARPGGEMHVVDLVALKEGRSRAPAVSRWSAGEAHLRTCSDQDAGELLDPIAKTAYRARILELEREIEESRAWNDSERAARAAEELDAVTRQVAGGLGLGGRSRTAASAAERARQAVTRAIRTTIKRISKAHPTLGRHLESTIRTGRFCSYTPDSRADAWTF